MRKLLEVPHMSQLEENLKFDWMDDKIDPEFNKDVSNVAYWTCGPTCLNMVLHYYNLSNLTTFDFINEFRIDGSELRKLYKNSNIPDVLWYSGMSPNNVGSFYALQSQYNFIKIANYFLYINGESLFKRYNRRPDYYRSDIHFKNHGFIDKITIPQIMSFIDDGIPVILLAGFTNGNTKDTGHYVLAIGYDTDKQTLIFNDPWGNPATADHKLIMVDAWDDHDDNPATARIKLPYKVVQYQSNAVESGEKVEILISELQKIITAKDTFANGTAIAGPVPYKLAFPLDIPEKQNPPLHWFHRSEASPGGFYPIGKNRCTHGGIHLCEQSDLMTIRAMAKGEVVAFRFFKKASEQAMRSSQQDELSANQGSVTFEDPSYSSFVMLRHKLTTTGDSKKEICFYSLYMNLAPPQSLTKAEEVVWFKKIKEHLDGGVQSFDFDNQGRFTWTSQSPGTGFYRASREEGHSLYNLSLDETDHIFLADGKDGQVVTFTDNFLAVNAGDPIGFSYKYRDENYRDAFNFIHWEVFVPGEGRDFDDLISELNSGSFSLEEFRQSDNFLDVSEINKLYPDLEFKSMLGNLFSVFTSDIKDLIGQSYIEHFNPYIDVNFQRFMDQKNNKAETTLPVLFYQNKNYDLTIKLDKSTSYDLENSLKFNIQCSLGESLKAPGTIIWAKAHGNNKFVIPSMGEEWEGGDSTIIETTLGALTGAKGLTLNVPVYARELHISQENQSSVILVRIEPNSNTELELFSDAFKENLRNQKLIHTPEWHKNSIDALIGKLKENRIVPDGYSFNEDNFSEIIWFDKGETNITGNNLDMNSTSTTHIHPATMLWLLKLLVAEGKIAFDEHRWLPKEKPDIKHFAFMKDPALADIRLGDKVKLFLLDQEITPSQYDPDNPVTFKLPEKNDQEFTLRTNDFGVFSCSVNLSWWSEYKCPVDGADAILQAGLVDEVTIEKPVIEAIDICPAQGSEADIQISEINITFNSPESSPRFLPGLLTLRYQINEEKKASDWTDLSSVFLLCAKIKEPGTASAKFSPALLLNQLVKGINKKLEDNEQLFVEARLRFPDGALANLQEDEKTFTLEEALSGNKLIESDKLKIDEADILDYPQQGYFSFDDSLPQIPALSDPEESELVFSTGPDSILQAEALVEITNTASSWLKKDDLSLTLDLNNSEQTLVKGNLEKARTAIFSENNKSYFKIVFPVEDSFFSEDAEKNNEVHMTLKYSIPGVDTENGTIIYEFQRIIKKPQITEITAQIDESSQNLIVRGKKKNVPQGIDYVLKVAFSGIDNAETPVNVNWTIFKTEASQDEENISFTIPSWQVCGNKVKVTFLPKIGNSFLNWDETDKAEFDLQAQSVFKKGTIVESGGYPSVYLRSNDNIQNHHNPPCLLNNGTSVRFICSDDQKIEQQVVKDSRNNYHAVGFSHVEYTNAEEKKTVIGWVYNSRVS